MHTFASVTQAEGRVRFSEIERVDCASIISYTVCIQHVWPRWVGALEPVKSYNTMLFVAFLPWSPDGYFLALLIAISSGGARFFLKLVRLCLVETGVFALVCDAGAKNPFTRKARILNF